MDVLIVERDELMRSVFADALEAAGIAAAIASDEGALKLPLDDVPQVVITGINRGHNEDLTGLKVISDMRRKWPQLCAIYLSALWPAGLRRDRLAAGERFLTNQCPFAVDTHRA
jgi:DNA-binding response OmpR family regulator